MDNKELKERKNHRKDNGDGYVGQRADGRWEARITVDGKTKCLYGKTQAEAKRKLKDYKLSIARGFHDVKKITLNEYLQNWLITFKLGTVKDSTYDRYESTFENHIKNSIGKMQMGSIQAADLQKLLNEKAQPTNRLETAISYSSVKKIVELLGPCFRYAVLKGDLNTDPMKFVNMPHKDNFEVSTKEMYSLTDGQMLSIKDVADMRRKNGEPYYRYAALYVILLNTGLREGEIIALTWDDIDFDNKTLVVNKAIMSNVKNRSKDPDDMKKRKSKLSTPKTYSGTRIIPLNASALYYLNQLKEYKETHNIKTNYVAYTNTGSYVSARNLQRTLDLLLTKAGVSHCGLHILRHTFGSTLLRKHVDISIVSKLMGHKTITVTYNKYIHVIEEEKAKAMSLNTVV